jgi:hypothetical protein
LKAMLDLPPLSDTVKKESSQFAVKCWMKLNPRRGTCKDGKYTLGEISVRHDFKASFEIKITDPDECYNLTTAQRVD